MSVTAVFTNDTLTETWSSTNKSDAWAAAEIDGGSITRKLGIPTTQSQNTALKTETTAIEKTHVGTWVTDAAPESFTIPSGASFAMNAMHGYESAGTLNAYLYFKISVVTESGSVLSFDRTVVDWTPINQAGVNLELGIDSGSAFPMGGYSGQGTSCHPSIASAETLATGERLAIEIGIDKTANKTGSTAFEYGCWNDTPDDEAATGNGTGAFGSCVGLPVNFSEANQSAWGNAGNMDEIIIPWIAGTDIIAWADIGGDWTAAKWETNPAAHYVNRAGGAITAQFWIMQDDDYLYVAMNNVIDTCIQNSDHHNLFICCDTDWTTNLVPDATDYLFHRDITAGGSNTRAPTFMDAQGTNIDQGEFILKGDGSVTYPKGYEQPTWNAGSTQLEFPSENWIEGTDYRMGGPGAAAAGTPNGGAGAYSEFKIKKSRLNSWNGYDPIGFIISMQCDVQGNGSTAFPRILGNQLDKNDWNLAGNAYSTTEGATASSKTDGDVIDFRPIMAINGHAIPPWTAADGDSTGSSEVLGVATSVSAGVGNATGESVSLAVGEAGGSVPTEADAESTGESTTSGQSSAIVTANGDNADGDAIVSGVGVQFNLAVGNSVGESASTGHGSYVLSGEGQCIASAEALGESNADITGIANAVGTSATAGDALSITGAFTESTSISESLGVSSNTVEADAAATSISESLGVSNNIVEADAAATAESSTQANASYAITSSADSTGTSATLGEVSYLINADFNAVGTSISDGVSPGQIYIPADAESTGESTADAIATIIWQTDTTSISESTSSADSGVLAQSDFVSSGTSQVSGIVSETPIATIVGAIGTSSGSAESQAIASTEFNEAGTSSAQVDSGAIKGSDANSAGTALTLISSDEVFSAIGSSIGSSLAQADGEYIVGADAEATSDSISTASGTAIANVDGSSVGESIVSGQSQSGVAGDADGSSTGESVATAEAGSIAGVDGSSTGESVATAEAGSIAGVDGSSVGTSIVLGESETEVNTLDNLNGVADTNIATLNGVPFANIKAINSVIL